eukprot:CAMPEP_0196215804 /NCGR_PEP_ID=MMETSP0912-20130531/30804_1 /TAXON_ID=49265 /ORGANISM="Thalassiosira rotula, Strain GSO102" /LENGTH=82 /DNA_ID=CAMNT_0041492785 /DNA_START=65 /DNA_END=316 /DNA_ORIENTATION=+
MAIPTTIEVVTTLSSGSYLYAVGINSLNDIISIRPLTNPKITANAVSVITLARTIHPSNAAIGSDIPAKHPHRNAFQRLPVA